MCVATLHTTTQPCAHRWYELVRSCNPGVGLHNCTEKLKLEGWEKRTDDCPWCDCDAAASNLPTGSCKLFGNSSTSTTSSTPSSPVATDLSSSPPNAQRLAVLGLDGASAAGIATLSSLCTLSRHTSVSSTESDDAIVAAASQRHREMNDRIHVYLTARPDEILPSASKNYPTYPQLQSGNGNGSGTDARSKMGSQAVTMKFKKSVRLGMGLLKP